MRIQDLYKKYQIPPNLARHQLEVAAVGEWVTEHWNGPALDKEALQQVLLLHDMGNIVKFKKPFLGEMADNAAYWVKVQKEFQEKYGTNAHDATEAILIEIGVSKKVLRIISEMGTIAMGSAKGEKSWEARIADFADTCVSPEGIVGFEKRVEDLIKRYGIARGDKKVQMWRENKEKIQKYVSADLSSEDLLKAYQRIPIMEKYSFEE